MTGGHWLSHQEKAHLISYQHKLPLRFLRATYILAKGSQLQFLFTSGPFQPCTSDSRVVIPTYLSLFPSVAGYSNSLAHTYGCLDTCFC